MDISHRDVDIIEKIRIEFDCVARCHKDHNFLLEVLSKESKEKSKLKISVDDNISLFKV